MATAKKKMDSAADHTLEWPFGRKNYLLMGLALVIIIIGFLLLWKGSISLAPILLVIGYGLIPFAIMAKGKADQDESASESKSAE